MFSFRKLKKFYRCGACGFEFANLDTQRVCSNCFACSACEIYTCPACDSEVVVKPVKKMKRGG